ncbi:winged helix-turn-helix domain-containing protein [Haloferax profundi]|uniref:AsnC family transcriptional regulator n=1 Tax=Haloferax profundi TaxID=1544718 RepID=A0A0W1SW37_9EURY|nr:winged helix-turn-helix domain-containing protein [Haloferax profundi]KTG30624.1 AsnC family transcriptional regulator [Haloferax profundi]
MSGSQDSDELLDLLGDEYVRSILAAASLEPHSVKDLSERCGVAQSTVYRRLDDMLAHDLLVERTELVADGSHHSVYEAKLTHLDIDVVDGEIRVDTNVESSPAERFTRIWDDIRRQ